MLLFSPISSPDGKREMFLHLEKALACGETLSSVSVVSLFDGVTISNDQVNASAVTDCATAVEYAAETGVEFTAETTKQAKTTAVLLITYEGSEGTKGTQAVGLPIVHVTE